MQANAKLSSNPSSRALLADPYPALGGILVVLMLLVPLVLASLYLHRLAPLGLRLVYTTLDPMLMRSMPLS